MSNSKVRGYNDRSGILYNEMNGLRQYKSKDILYPRTKNVYPMYENTRNVEALLKTGLSRKSFFNKGGLSKIPPLPNSKLEDGGFKNKGNVAPQDDGQPKRLTVTKRAKQLAASANYKLPITPEQKTSEDMKTLQKFNSFIASLNKSKMGNLGYSNPQGRAPRNWFKGAIDMPPDSLI